MITFDLTNDINTPLKYVHYGKFSGLMLAYKFGLPSPANGWILDNLSSDISRLDRKVKYICRPDAPMGMGNLLPQGRDLEVDEIYKFYKTVKNICSDGILIIFDHPFYSCCGKYEERYMTSGGISVYIEKHNMICIEYVGPGFDVGDITRGKHVHTVITFPVNGLQCTHTQLYRYITLGIIGSRFDISTSEYLLSRKLRIKELVKNFGCKNTAHIQAQIPKNPIGINLSMFKRIISSFVEPIIFNRNNLSIDRLCIIANIYCCCYYVFEIWQPKRFLSDLI